MALSVEQVGLYATASKEAEVADLIDGLVGQRVDLNPPPSSGPGSRRRQAGLDTRPGIQLSATMIGLLASASRGYYYDDKGRVSTF
jgi:hypothetical protein